LMKRKDVVEFTGLCYTTVYNLEKKGKFPRRRELSPGRVAWIREEVVAWANKAVARVGSGSAQVAVLLLADMADGKLNLFGLIRPLYSLSRVVS